MEGLCTILGVFAGIFLVVFTADTTLYNTTSLKSIKVCESNSGVFHIKSKLRSSNVVVECNNGARFTMENTK